MSQFPREESRGPKLLVNRQTIRAGGTKGLNQIYAMLRAAKGIGALTNESLVIGFEKNQDNVNAFRKFLKPYKRRWLGRGWRNPEVILETIPGERGEFYKSLQTSMDEFTEWHAFCDHFASKVRPIYPRVGNADIAIDPLAEGGHALPHIDLLMCLAHQGVTAPINLAWLVVPQDKQSKRIFNGILNTFVNGGAFGYDAAILTDNGQENQLRSKEQMDYLVALGLQTLLHRKAHTTKELSRYDIITELTGREIGKRHLIGVSADSTEYPARYNYLGGIIPWTKAFEDDVVNATKKVVRSTLNRTRRSDLTGLPPIQGETTHIALLGKISRTAFEKATDRWRNDADVNIVYLPIKTNRIVAVGFVPVEPPEIPTNDGVETFEHYLQQFSQRVQVDVDSIKRLWKSRDIVASPLDSFDEITDETDAEETDDEEEEEQ